MLLQESDIVVASLVRSNRDDVIGFMQELERINVLLSRARYGMILIGNTDTLTRSTVDTDDDAQQNTKQKGTQQWRQVLSMLNSTNSVVTGLPAVCKHHPADGTRLLSTLSEFSNTVPDGGCNRLCGRELSCKHVCQLRYV
jgi:AAA domain